MDSVLPTPSAAASIRPLRENEVDEADRIFRLAFGTFLGMPDPLAFMEGAQLVRARWRTNPNAFLAADLDGALAGSSYATRWGSMGFVGPLTIRPELWDRGLAQRLLDGVMGLFRGWETRHIGLFTFPHSPKHIALYQKFGFWPRSLTAVMRKRVAAAGDDPNATLLSEFSDDERRDTIDACFDVTDPIHAGLDLRGEIRAVLAQGTGETVLLWDGSRLEAFAICHCGPGSEAETGTAYVKFGACRLGPKADVVFARLLAACERFASRRYIPSLVAGVNTARQSAYRAMLASGFKSENLGIVMHRPNEPAYNREDVFLIDDWR
jgi:GNAT superfamily N-acetyltransferase